MNAPRPSARRLLPELEKGLIKASAAAPLLKILHIMNADGSISADMRRKFKQANRLVELFLPVLDELTATGRPARIVDANCGNSYASFLLYHAVVNELKRPCRIFGIDRQEARVSTCRERAAALGYDGMSFETGSVADAPLPEDIDLLLSLHGCDTATDEALVRGVALKVPYLDLVPCCQREIRPLLRDEGPFGPFSEDGIVAQDFAAVFTDVMRALFLRTRGYRASLSEFVPLEHTLKNRLIRAKFTRRHDVAARERLDALAAALTAEPFLLRAGAALAPWV